MRYQEPECCPPPRHPRLPEIAPGLATLPRQLAGFPEWRAALLRDIGEHDELAGWQADAPDDLGVMLLEAWAYILDVLAFYDARIAERAYLRTAHDEIVTGEIASLIGFVPRPALSSSVELALEARGADPVDVPALTAFRSEAFGDEPPQVFETDAANTAWPQRNRWRIAPIRELTLQDGILRFRAAEGPTRGSVIAISDASGPFFAGRVRRVTAKPARDGERYLAVEFAENPSLAEIEARNLADLTADILGLEIGLSRLVPEPIIDEGSGNWKLRLDSLYPRLAEGQLAVLRVGAELHAIQLGTVRRHDHEIPIKIGEEEDAPTTNQIVPLSEVTIEGVADVSGDNVFLYVGARPLGKPTQPAKSELTLADIAAGADLVGALAPLGEAPGNGKTIAVGARKRGALLSGTTTIALPQGDGTFAPAGSALDFAEPLHTPVRLYGNVMKAIRGETVREEVLGSGDAALEFQSFELRKKPLSWVATSDPGIALGRYPRIIVSVNGEYWSWVDTLYGHGAEDRVFTVTMEPDGTAHIGFGDGKTGARLPSGVNNVRASYAFGAGAASPPAGTIKQIVRPPRGIERVVGPLAPSGGADAQDASEIAALAPATALTLGKAVSLDDFAAMARNHAGIINATASTRWDPHGLRQVIDIAIIAEQGDPRAELQEFLEARAAPGIAVNVTLATRVPVYPFRIELTIDPGFVADIVRAEVSALLLDPINGMLCPRNIPIGAPLFRSRLLAAIHSVRGVASVPAIVFAGSEMPYAKSPSAGAWYDLLEFGEIA